MSGHNQKTPLKLFWNVFSVFMTLVSLASLSSTLVEWKSFIRNVVDFYHIEIIDPLLKIINISIPHRVVDYMTIGIIISISAYKAHKTLQDSKKKNSIPLEIFLLILLTYVWPFLILVLFLGIFSRHDINYLTNISRTAWEWIAIISISFILMLIMNSIIKT